MAALAVQEVCSSLISRDALLRPVSCDCQSLETVFNDTVGTHVLEETDYPSVVSVVELFPMMW